MNSVERSAVLRCSFVLLLAFPIAVSGVGQTAAFVSGSTVASQALCTKMVTSGTNTLLAKVNSTKAQELAEQSSGFQASLAGHGYQFVTVGAVASIDSSTCSVVALGQLSVDYTVSGVYITTGNLTVPEGITVFENPASTSVQGVTVDNMPAQGLNYYSGQEAQYKISGYAQPLYETQQYYYQQALGTNAACYTYYMYNTNYQCFVSMWSGLSGNYGGGGFLVQSGTDVNYQCNSGGTCPATPVYSSWWEWLPGYSPYPCGSSSYPVYKNDDIAPMEENMYYSGGSSAQYEANVIDWTQSWTCTSGTWSQTGTAYWVESEFEIPSGGSAALPTFNSVTMAGYDLCWGTTSCTSVGSTGTSLTADVMNNFCPSSGTSIQNIGLSTPSGGSYNQLYSSNCGT